MLYKFPLKLSKETLIWHEFNLKFEYMMNLYRTLQGLFKFWYFVMIELLQGNSKFYFTTIIKAWKRDKECMIFIRRDSGWYRLFFPDNVIILLKINHVDLSCCFTLCVQIWKTLELILQVQNHKKYSRK